MYSLVTASQPGLSESRSGLCSKLPAMPSVAESVASQK